MNFFLWLNIAVSLWQNLAPYATFCHRDMAKSATMLQIRQGDIARTATILQIRQSDIARTATILQICQRDMVVLNIQPPDSRGSAGYRIILIRSEMTYMKNVSKLLFIHESVIKKYAIEYYYTSKEVYCYHVFLL